MNKNVSLKNRIFDIKKKLRIRFATPMYKMPLEYRIKKDMEVFERTYGYKFDLYNAKSFTEKIHAYKLLYSNPVMGTIVDKYEFKNYIKKKIGGGDEKTTKGDFCAKTYGIYENLAELKRAWESLPKEFVLKSTISSDGKNIIFVKDKETTDFKAICKEVKKWFNPRNTLLNSFSLAYYNQKPRVLAEEWLHIMNDNGNLRDYKFFCFDGMVKFVYTTSRTFADFDYPRTFFDLNWNKINASLGSHPTAETAEKPKHLEEMIEISKKLSKGFPFVRMDFYDSEEMPMLGEMTFYPTGGFMPIEPHEFDVELGELMHIPPDMMLH